MLQKIRIELKWALLFTLVSMLWVWLEKLAGFHSTYISKQPMVTLIYAIPAIGIYVMALLEKKRSYFGNKMNYLDGLISGLILSAIITVLSPLAQYIEATFITPDYFENAIRYAVQKGILTVTAATEYFSLKNYIKQSIMGTSIMGTITTVVVVFFIQTKKYSGKEIHEDNTVSGS